MKEPFFRYTTLTGIAAIAAMLGLNHCKETKPKFKNFFIAPFIGGDEIDNSHTEEPGKECFSLLVQKPLPDVKTAKKYYIGVDVDAEGRINYHSMAYLNLRPEDRSIDQREAFANIERIASTAIEKNPAEKIWEHISSKEIGGAPNLNFKENFIPKERDPRDIPADGEFVRLESRNPGEPDRAVYSGKRSPLSLEVLSQARLIYILLDDALTFDKNLLDVPNQDSSSLTSPLHNYSVNKDKTVLTVDFYSDSGRFLTRNHCRYGVNIFVKSTTKVGSEEFVTPLVVDPIIKNNGSGP